MVLAPAGSTRGATAAMTPPAIGDVPDAVDAVSRIDDVSAGDHQVVFRRRLPRVRRQRRAMATPARSAAPARYGLGTRRGHRIGDLRQVMSHGTVQVAPVVVRDPAARRGPRRPARRGHRHGRGRRCAACVRPWRPMCASAWRKIRGSGFSKPASAESTTCAMYWRRPASARLCSTVPSELLTTTRRRPEPCRRASASATPGITLRHNTLARPSGRRTCRRSETSASRAGGDRWAAPDSGSINADQVRAKQVRACRHAFDKQAMREARAGRRLRAPERLRHRQPRHEPPVRRRPTRSQSR